MLAQIAPDLDLLEYLIESREIHFGRIMEDECFIHAFVVIFNEMTTYKQK